MRIFVLSVAALLTTLSLAFADELDQFREREQLLNQKLSREVAAAVDTSARLERTNPAAARETIQNALAQVKATPGLTDSVRADLTRRLQSRLANIPSQVAQAKPLTPPRPGTTPIGTGAAPLPPTFAGGSSTPPASVAETARNLYDRQSKAINNFGDDRETRAKGFNGVFTGIDKAAVPTDRDMAFNPNHKELAARRTVAMNPKEEAVMSALGSTIDGDFGGMTFRQALETITQKTGLIIIPDSASLKEAGVEYDDPVNFKINAKIAVRTALRKILGDRGLSYIVSEGGINVVTVQRARETTVVRVYNVRDLVTPIQPQPQYIVGPFGGLTPVAPGVFPPGTPGVTPSFAQTMGATIAEMVRVSVDPNYWAPTGPGTVTFNEATGSLIVRASAEVQFMVGSSLNRR